MAHKLFPIPLMGQGTEDVESLPSYLSRCAYEHGVSVGVLAKWMSNFDGSEIPGFPKPLGAIQDVETLARFNEYSNRMRTALEALTGQDLRCRPLEFLNRHIYCISTEIGGFRWCPECFAEMNKFGEGSYIKQLWHMKAITHCHVHRTPLLSRCEHCDNEQKLLSTEMPLSYCTHCETSLAIRNHMIKPGQNESSWKSYSYDIVDVFVQTARTVPDNDPDSQRESFECIFREFSSCGVLSKEWAEIFNEYFRKWPNGKRLVSQRRLAYYLNITLFQLLNLEKGSFLGPLWSKIDEDIPEHLEKVGRIHRNHVEIKQRLEKIGCTYEPPVSLKMLARLGDVSVGYLEYRFPDLAKRVVDRYLRHQQHQLLIRRYQAQTAALKFFTDERYATYAQSRKEAYRVLSAETGLPKWVLKDAIQVAYNALQNGT